MSSTTQADMLTVVRGVKCPEEACEDVFETAGQVVDHADDAHGVTLANADVPQVTREVDNAEKLFEALYNANSHAKKYAELGTENYRKGKKATAKMNSVKKDALYGLKHDIIKGLAKAGEVATAERHRIDGTVFVCHYFQADSRWSFHTPVDQWTGPAVSGEIQELDDFESTSEKERSDMSLKAALLYLKEQTGVSANNQLTQEYVRYGYGDSYFAGWSYLSDGDR
jgi:hypothetical protein